MQESNNTPMHPVERELLETQRIIKEQEQTIAYLKEALNLLLSGVTEDA